MVEDVQGQCDATAKRQRTGEEQDMYGEPGRTPRAAWSFAARHGHSSAASMGPSKKMLVCSFQALPSFRGKPCGRHINHETMMPNSSGSLHTGEMYRLEMDYLREQQTCQQSTLDGAQYLR